MSYILALFLPGVAVMAKGRIGLGILLCLLHITIIGWLPACIVAFAIINETDRKRDLKALQRAEVKQSASKPATPHVPHYSIHIPQIPPTGQTTQTSVWNTKYQNRHGGKP